MIQHPIYAIGAVILHDLLTIAVRRGELIEEPLQFPIRTPLEAAALLLKYRADNASIYVAASGSAAQVLEEIKKRYSKSPDEIVNGMAPAQSMAEGVQFANRRSELFFKFRKLVEEGKLLVPALYNEQITAFEQAEQSGKIWFPSPDDVAAKLGRYPAYAVCAVLAAIKPARSGAVKMKSLSGVGHDPYAKRLT